MCGIQVVLLWKEEKKVGGKLLTSANIKKDIQTFYVWCSWREGRVRGARGRARDNEDTPMPGWQG